MLPVFRSFYLPVDKIYYPLTVGTEKCTVVINVVQLDNQEAMADFHRYFCG